MNAGLRESLQAVLDQPILDMLPVSGGCISEAWQVRTAEETVFVKLSTGLLPGMLAAEAEGLHELAKSGAIRVPEVIRLTEDFLILEFIPTAINPPSDFWSKLGRQLANLHAYSQKIPGFHQDNFIGRSPQKNHCKGTGKSFSGKAGCYPNGKWQCSVESPTQQNYFGSSWRVFGQHRWRAHQRRLLCFMEICGVEMFW
jgi:fructosamine-3-kinase